MLHQTLRNWFTKTDTNTNIGSIVLSWVYLATHELQIFEGDTPKKGTTPELIISIFTDSDKQTVHIRVFVESKYGLTVELRLLFHCHFLKKKIKNTAGLA